MLLKKLKIKNIRSYKEQEIEFPEGSILLSGDIGSGKTSILLAIEFALFGLQPGQKGSSLLRNHEDEAEVRLEFEVDGNNIVIERKIVKSGKSMSQSDTAIIINNERFEGSVTEIKNKILTVLNYPPEFAKKTNDLYRFTVYTPQEEMKQIILESSDARLNTLRHIFGIDKYKRIEENIEVATAKIRQEIRVKEAEIGNVEQRKLGLEQKKQQVIVQNSELAKAESQILGIQKIKSEKQLELDDLSKKMNEKNRLENEKEKSELTLNSKKDFLFNYERDIKSLQAQIKGAEGINFNERDIESTKNKIKVQEQMLKELNESYLSLYTSIQSDELKVRELKILIEKISSLQKCTTCLQVVNEEHKHHIVLRASEDLSQISQQAMKDKKARDEISSRVEQSKKLVESLKQSLSQLEILKIKLESITEKKSRIKQLEKQASVIFGDMDMIKKHIEGIDKLISEFSSYQSDYERKSLEMREINIRENSCMIKKAEIRAEMQFLEKQIIDTENEIKRLEEIREKINYMRELEFWLSNKFLEFVLHTEKNVMLKLREDFSNLFAGWFSTLVSDSITVKLDESFSPAIRQSDYEVDYAYLSGGERTAVALAYRLALNQTINSLLSKIKTRDIVILDEPTDGFSESQLDKMRDVLNQLNVRQLILVSHEQKIEGFVNNIIKFKKTDGVTEVEK
jgi:exonuclease SbcC